MTTPLIEVQIDGLPGPTHHFGGLSPGNKASLSHAGFRAHPRAAAFQGLEKMRQVMRLGVIQAWLPPLLRPDISLLRACGFTGSDAEVLTAAAHDSHLLHVATSSAFMWSANCATIIPETDSNDGRCHVVLANLQAMSHRAPEGPQRAAQWRALARHVPALVIHDPLPLLPALGDEGAANHSRIACDGNVTHVFVVGRHAGAPALTKNPARQTCEASAAVARCGKLAADKIMTVQQLPEAIDAGAFHNDVVMVGCLGHVLIHAHAWADQARVLALLRARHPSLRIAEISADELSLEEAVASYLFNSQLVATAAGMVLIAPAQAKHGRAAAVIQKLQADGFITGVHFMDLTESMANGGGPACLRLRLAVSQATLATFPVGFLLDEARIDALAALVQQHYRETLSEKDLHDPDLIEESLHIQRAFSAHFCT